MVILIIKEESPPAGNHKTRTARAVTCPRITCPERGGGEPHPVLSQMRMGVGVVSYMGVPHPLLGWGGGTQSFPGWERGGEIHPLLDGGGGIPYPVMARVTPQKQKRHLEPVEVLWDRGGVPPPPGVD